MQINIKNKQFYYCDCLQIHTDSSYLFCSLTAVLIYLIQYILQLLIIYSKLSVKQMHTHKQNFSSIKKHSGRIIVDQYEQRKREREQQGICKFCKNQIPIRLMNSHRNVCAFGVSLNSIEIGEKQDYQNQNKLGCSTYTQKNHMRNYYDDQTPERLISQRNLQRQSNIGNSNKKVKNNKILNLESGSVRNYSQNKNQRQSNRKTSGSKNTKKNMAQNTKLFESKKLFNLDKFQKKQKVNKSLISQQYKQYFGQANNNFNNDGKKKGVSKVKKQIKNAWMQKINRKNKTNQNAQRKKSQKEQRQQRQQKLRKLQNETEKLKKQEQQLIKQLRKQKKNQKKHNVRNNSEIKREKQRQREQSRSRQPNQQRKNSRPVRNNQNPIPNNSSNNYTNTSTRNNQNRQPRRNRRRNPTVEQSYYQQIPHNHPHQTLNFISQTINQQFQMMKQQFEHMNQFFSNFVPFSTNGFVYFERNQQSDYSIGSSASSLDYEEQQQKGLYDEQIQLLPRYKYEKKMRIQDQCPICINSINHQQIVKRMPCNHLFHCQCINQWLKRKAICPVCRDSVGDLGL